MTTALPSSASVLDLMFAPGLHNVLASFWIATLDKRIRVSLVPLPLGRRAEVCGYLPPSR
jgi:hypothetical protein